MKLRMKAILAYFLNSVWRMVIAIIAMIFLVGLVIGWCVAKLVL